MAITLTGLPTITPPVTSYATGATFCADYAKLANANLGRQALLAIAIHALAYVVSGTYDYTTAAGHKQLVQDATSVTKGLQIFDPLLAKAVTTWESGNNADSSNVGTDVETLLGQVKDWSQLPEQTLERMYAYLRHIAGT